VGALRNLHAQTKENIHPKLVEKWIEDFLIESEATHIPSTQMRIDKSKALAR